MPSDRQSHCWPSWGCAIRSSCPQWRYLWRTYVRARGNHGDDRPRLVPRGHSCLVLLLAASPKVSAVRVNRRACSIACDAAGALDACRAGRTIGRQGDGLASRCAASSSVGAEWSRVISGRADKGGRVRTALAPPAARLARRRRALDSLEPDPAVLGRWVSSVD
jgi:hypothetical protein